MSKLTRAEIIVSGVVQGVGFRYFVLRNATSLGLKGYTINLFNGDVLTVVEGESGLINELIDKLKVGPKYADVRACRVEWKEFKNEFNKFEIRY